MIYCKLSIDVTVVKCKDRVVGISQGEGVDLDVALASRLS
jgi:hypothetical protein